MQCYSHQSKKHGKFDMPTNGNQSKKHVKYRNLLTKPSPWQNRCSPSFFTCIWALVNLTHLWLQDHHDIIYAHELYTFKHFKHIRPQTPNESCCRYRHKHPSLGYTIESSKKLSKILWGWSMGKTHHDDPLFSRLDHECHEAYRSVYQGGFVGHRASEILSASLCYLNLGNVGIQVVQLT